VTKLISIRIKEDELALLKEAAKIAYDPAIHIKRYGYNSFMREASLKRAQELLRGK